MKRKTSNNSGTPRSAAKMFSEGQKLVGRKVRGKRLDPWSQSEAMPDLDPPVDFRVGPADVVTFFVADRVVATMTLDKRVNVKITGPVTVEVEKLADITNKAREALRDG